MKIAISILSLSAGLLWGSCRGDEYLTPGCDKTLQADVVKTEAPAAGTAGTMIEIPVSLQCVNGCGQFGYFSESWRFATEVDLKVMAEYKGCTCTEDMPVRKAVYRFVPTVAGTYYLHFIQPDSTVMTDTITVH